VASTVPRVTFSLTPPPLLLEDGFGLAELAARLLDDAHPFDAGLADPAARIGGRVHFGRGNAFDLPAAVAADVNFVCHTPDPPYRAC
jgi:hypothetical protein